jgi:hypothetical protein
MITMLASASFTSEMEFLRRCSFLYPTGSTLTKDEFDEISTHVTVRVDKQLAGILRFTPNPPCVFRIWSQGRIPSVDLLNCATFSRLCVANKWKKLGLQRLLLIYTLCLAWMRGYRWGIGAVEPTLPLQNFLRKLDFVNEGNQVVLFEPIGFQVLVQPLRLDMTLNQMRWRTMMSSETSRLERMGHTISTEI